MQIQEDLNLFIKEKIKIKLNRNFNKFNKINKFLIKNSFDKNLDFFEKKDFFFGTVLILNSKKV